MAHFICRKTQYEYVHRPSQSLWQKSESLWKPCKLRIWRSSLSNFKDVLRLAWDFLPGNWNDTPRSSTSPNFAMSSSSFNLTQVFGISDRRHCFHIVEDSFLIQHVIGRVCFYMCTTGQFWTDFIHPQTLCHCPCLGYLYLHLHLYFFIHPQTLCHCPCLCLCYLLYCITVFAVLYYFMSLPLPLPGLFAAKTPCCFSFAGSHCTPNPPRTYFEEIHFLS